MKSIKINKEYKYHTNNGNTVCILTSFVEIKNMFQVLNYWDYKKLEKGLGVNIEYCCYDGIKIISKGVAKLHPEDEYSEEKGKAIARAKATKTMYNALKMISGLAYGAYKRKSAFLRDLRGTIMALADREEKFIDRMKEK